MGQSASNVRVTIAKQTGKGVRKTGSGSVLFRVAPSAGISGSMANIVSPTIGQDGLESLPGLGTRKGGAVYQQVLGVTKQDSLIPALCRIVDWLTIAPLVGGVDATSITTQADGVTFVGYNPLSAGWKFGMRFKMSGHSTTANNGKWFTVFGATSTRLLTTPAGATAFAPIMVVDATPDASFTITCAKFAFRSGAPVDTYFTGEELQQDATIPQSEIMDDAKLSKCDFNAGVDAKFLLTTTFVARDFDYLDGTTSPVAPIHTSPTAPSGAELEMTDGIIIVDGNALNIATDVAFSYDGKGDTSGVLGADTSPDVYMGNASLSGSINVNQEDMTFLKKYRNKTVVSMMFVVQEKESDPKDFISFTIGNALLKTPAKGLAPTGPMKYATPFGAGRDETGGDRAATTLLISSSAP